MEEAVRRHLRPELVNRLTKVVHFKQLGTGTVREILGKLLADFNLRLADRGVTVELDESAEELILREGFGEHVGAGKTIADHPGRINLNMPGKPLKRDWLHCNSLDYNAESGQLVINSVQGKLAWEYVNPVTREGAVKVLGNATGTLPALSKNPEKIRCASITHPLSCPRSNHLMKSVARTTSTLTLKNVSPHLRRVLKAQALRHKRSLNQEAILCLERAVAVDADRPSLASPPPPVSVGAILQPWNNRAEMLEGFLDRDS